MSSDNEPEDPLEQFRKLQQFVQNTDIFKLQEMYKTGQLQQMLDPNNYYTNWPKPSEVEIKKNALEPVQETADFKDDFWNDFSEEEKLEIQKKLATYDSTLRSMLHGIKNGTISDETAVQPILQNISESIDMKNLLKNVQAKNIQKIKVDDDVSVSLESNNLSSNRKQDPSEYSAFYEQVRGLLNQNKGFDFFLKNVAHMESTGIMCDPADSDQMELLERQTAAMKLASGNEPGDFSQNLDPNLMNSIDGLQDFVDANVESIFMRLCGQNMEMQSETEKQEWRKKFLESKRALSAAGFTDFLKKCDEKIRTLSADEVAEMTSVYFEKERQASGVATPHNHIVNSVPDEDEKRSSFIANINQEYEESLAKNRKLQEEKHQLMQYQEMLMKQQSESHTNSFHPEYVADPNAHSSNSRPQLVTYGNPTPEQRQQLQRECLNRLFAGDSVSHDEQTKKTKKKKNRKKKKGGNSSTVCGYSHADLNSINHIGVKNPQNDTWLCELCEYKIVYGELPVFLSEWLMRKSNQQEKMENYQRYLMAQRNEHNREASMSISVSRPEYIGNYSLNEMPNDINSNRFESLANANNSEDNFHHQMHHDHDHKSSRSHQNENPHRQNDITYQEGNSHAPRDPIQW